MTVCCLNAILWPLSFVLSWGLGVSAYLWLAYSLVFTGSHFAYAMMNHWLALGFLFPFLYFPMIQPVLGTSQNYYSLGQLVGILFYSILGGLLGFLFGKFVDQHLGAAIGQNRFLLWLALALIGAAIGALVARGGSKG